MSTTLVPTGYARTCSWTGSGKFQCANTVAHGRHGSFGGGNSDLTDWYPTTTLSTFGFVNDGIVHGSQYSCFFDSSAILSSVAFDVGSSTWHISWTVTWRIRRQVQTNAGLVTTTFDVVSATFTSAQYSLSGGATLVAVLGDSTGTWDLAENDTLTEYVKLDDFSGNGRTLETRRVTGGSIAGSASGTVNVYRESAAGALTFLESQVWNTSHTLTWGDSAATDIPMDDYRTGTLFTNLGPAHALEASLACSDVTLNSLYATSLAVTKGSAQLTGSPSGLTFQWTPNDYVYDHAAPGGGFWWYDSAAAHLVNPSAGTLPTPVFPSADVRFGPSFAVEVYARCYRWKDASLVDATLDHYRSPGVFLTDPTTALVGSFNTVTGGSPALYRWPASGWNDSVYATVSDGACSYWNSTATLSSTTDGVSNPSGATLTGAVNAQLRLEAMHHFFQVNAPWADGYGTYRKSWSLFTGNNQYPERLPVLLPYTFNKGDLTFATTHAFQVFQTLSDWSVVTLPPAVLAANPGQYSTATTLSLDGSGNLQAVCTGVNSLLTTLKSSATLGYYLRHFGYRYVTLRVKSTVAGARFRFGLDSMSFSGSGVGPRYSWDVVITAANSFQDIVLDLLFPDNSTVVSGGGQITYEESTDTAHPATWFPVPFTSGTPAGARVWLELMTPATYTFASLTGFYKTGGTRQPLRLLYPLLGTAKEPLNRRVTGDKYDFPVAWDADFPGNIPTFSNLMRVLANGAHGFTLTPSTWNGSTFVYKSLLDIWTEIKARLDNATNHVGTSRVNDTGITVTTTPGGSFDTQFYKMVDSLGFEELRAGVGVGRDPALLVPGTTKAFPCQLRNLDCIAYPGMGHRGQDMIDAPAYGRAARFYLERILDGEALLNFQATSPATIGVTLADNDLGTSLVTVAPDDDGLARLPAHYGTVFPFDNATDSAQGTLGFSGEVSYTTQGLLENSYWARISGYDDGPQLDGTGYWVFGGASPSKTDLAILDRFPAVYTVPRPTGFDYPTLLREYTSRLYLFARTTTGQLVVRRYDDADASPTLFTLDSGSNCRNPSFDMVDRVIEGTYLSGTSPVLARSRDHGATWEKTTIPGTYSVLSSVHHRGRLVLMGWTGAAWVVRVGTLADDGTYSWSAETAAALTLPSRKGMLLDVGTDGAVRFLYLDTNGAPQLATARVVAQNGTNSWAVQSLPGTYTQVTAGEHRGRKVLLGWTASGGWEQRVGSTQDDYSTDWQGPVTTTVLANPTRKGRLRVWQDKLLELAYLDIGGGPVVVRCRSMSRTATGSFS